ncbi:MAG: signal recognition particle protein [Candidatus Delongbacteria bacterium]|nr:signal recognition particle protein [Candidatus Delongbacteria bacterium]
MFNELTEKFGDIFHKVRGYGKITDKNIEDTLKEIRLALLSADVNYKVVKEFIQGIQSKAIGQDVVRSVTPGQAFVKIVYDEMVNVLGQSNRKLKLEGQSPYVIMLCGLQGSGKTTLAGKLANLLRKDKKNPLLVAADIYRPAAIEQLIKVGASLGIEVYSEKNNSDAVSICRNAYQYAVNKLYPIIILDTAGRLHIDQQMMQELDDIRRHLNPTEILLVVDSMIGQDAVTMARDFNQLLDVSGLVLTKLDGDTRGGAALSITRVTGKPILFAGIGEKMNELEPFYPERMASRILGMGDIVTLVEKAQEAFDEKKAVELEKKIRKNQFNLEDFLHQLQQIKKMGPLESLMAMIPGFNSSMMKDVNVDQNELKYIEAIILSMTPKERANPEIINGSRRKRISMGSGRSVAEINRLLKQFEMMKKMMKKFTSLNRKEMVKHVRQF